jgi:hypothetical protein
MNAALATATRYELPSSGFISFLVVNSARRLTRRGRAVNATRRHCHYAESHRPVTETTISHDSRATSHYHYGHCRSGDGLIGVILCRVSWPLSFNYTRLAPLKLNTESHAWRIPLAIGQASANRGVSTDWHYARSRPHRAPSHGAVIPPSRVEEIMKLAHASQLIGQSIERMESATPTACRYYSDIAREHAQLDHAIIIIRHYFPRGTYYFKRAYLV